VENSNKKMRANGDTYTHGKKSVLVCMIPDSDCTTVEITRMNKWIRLKYTHWE